MTDPFTDDPIGRLFATLVADVDARADAYLADRAEQRRKQAKASRERSASRAISEFPLAAKRAAESRWCNRVEFDGGFHIEPRNDAYQPYVGDLLRISYTTATGAITATRQPAPGRPEAPRKVTPRGAIRLLREMVASLEENMAPISYGPEGCQCAFVTSPPCSFCENSDECEACGQFVLRDDMRDHMDIKHPDEEGA